MKKPIAYLSFAEWIADQIKALAPHSNTVKPIGVYFATGDGNEVNVDLNRKVAGYSNWHFSDFALAYFYGAISCTFNSEYGITLLFDSNDKVVGKDGFWKPRKRR